MALAGINMAVFELTAGRHIQTWGHDAKAPALGRVAAGLSILLWICVIFAGRMVGFNHHGGPGQGGAAAAAKRRFRQFPLGRPRKRRGAAARPRHACQIVRRTAGD